MGGAAGSSEEDSDFLLPEPDPAPAAPSPSPLAWWCLCLISLSLGLSFLSFFFLSPEEPEAAPEAEEDAAAAPAPSAAAPEPPPSAPTAAAAAAELPPSPVEDFFSLSFLAEPNMNALERLDFAGLLKKKEQLLIQCHRQCSCLKLVITFPFSRYQVSRKASALK